MKYLNVVFLFIMLLLTVSCKKSSVTEPENTEENPFSNGSNERSMVVVISDIHLGADLNYAECKENLSVLEKFLLKIRESQNIKELVIAGDMLDEWFVPATTDTYEGKGQREFVQHIATANKGVFDAFNSIIQDGKIKVTYVPGNHDLTITAANVELVLPGINQARDPEQGLGTYSPDGMPLLAIEHSHRYNFFCAPDPISNSSIAHGSIMPPGYFFTRIAALHVIQNCRTAGDTIQAVTQNSSSSSSQDLAFIYWNVWKSLMTALPVENKFSDKIIVTNIDGFSLLYSIKDLMPYQSTPGGYIDMNLYKGIQDSWNERQLLNRVQVNIPAAEAIMYAASNSETDNQANIQYFMNPNSNKKIVVFGHTHMAKITQAVNYKGEKTIYANSGTWIDHNPNATNMNFLVITPQKEDVSSQTTIKLYTYSGGITTKLNEDSLRY